MFSKVIDNIAPSRFPRFLLRKSYHFLKPVSHSRPIFRGVCMENRDIDQKSRREPVEIEKNRLYIHFNGILAVMEDFG